MHQIDLDEQTYARIRFAARMLRVSEAEVVARAIDEYGRNEEREPPRDPWEPIPLYGEYKGRRVEGQYVIATRRLTVTTEPLAGQTFRSPSAAARAVVAALNPDRVANQTNGWRFWRIAETHARLATLR